MIDDFPFNVLISQPVEALRRSRFSMDCGLVIVNADETRFVMTASYRAAQCATLRE